MATMHTAYLFGINKGIRNHGVKVDNIFDVDVPNKTSDIYFGPKTDKNGGYYHKRPPLEMQTLIANPLLQGHKSSKGGGQDSH